jgi:hypothetical protein
MTKPKNPQIANLNAALDAADGSVDCKIDKKTAAKFLKKEEVTASELLNKTTSEDSKKIIAACTTSTNACEAAVKEIVGGKINYQEAVNAAVKKYGNPKTPEVTEIPKCQTDLPKVKPAASVAK